MLNETFYCIALRYLPNCNNIFIKRLIDKFETATNIFTQSGNYFRQLKQKYPFISIPFISNEIRCKVEIELEWMSKNGVSICFYNDAHYPFRLKNCCDSPYLFYYKGNNNFNPQKSVAIIGTRNASQYGKEMVKRIITELSAYQVTIVSGLAEGIDTEAHKHALFRQQQTYAVLGSGLDRIYPASNEKLSMSIVKEGGALISEYPHYIKPDRLHFPHRNRIIAGLSDATVVVESPKRGGSMITAYIASSYNRDVFAVPGNILSDNHSGCHELIRKNIAAIVTSGNEIADMMGWKS